MSSYEDFTHFDVNRAILRQYNDSDIVALAQLFLQSMGISDFMDDFYENIWDVRTANTYGLDIWGKIVGITRVMTYTETGLYFGFREATISEATTTNPQPFSTYPFYSNGANKKGTVVLTDNYFRKAIMMKAMANITDCTAPRLNAALMFMFSDSGNAWVEHDGPMAMSYHFDFTPTSADLAIIQSGDILPRPAGCVISYIFETD